MVDDSGLNRREYLITVSSVGATALTGCSSDEGGEQTPENGQEATETSTPEPTPTSTPEPSLDIEIPEEPEIWDRMVLGADQLGNKAHPRAETYPINATAIDPTTMNWYLQNPNGETQELTLQEPTRLEELGQHVLEARENTGQNQEPTYQEQLEIIPRQIDVQENNQRLMDALGKFPNTGDIGWINVEGMKNVGSKEALEDGLSDVPGYNHDKQVEWFAEGLIASEGDDKNPGRIIMINYEDLDDDFRPREVAWGGSSFEENYRGKDIFYNEVNYHQYSDNEEGILAIGKIEALRECIDVAEGSESLETYIGHLVNQLPSKGKNAILSFAWGEDTKNSEYGDPSTFNDQPYNGKGILDINYEPSFRADQEEGRESLYREETYVVGEEDQLVERFPSASREMEGVIGTDLW